MIRLTRTNSQNSEFIKLVRELDADLAVRDGDDHAFYAQYNKIDLIKHVVVAYIDETPVGCGAIKEYAEGVVEVKRMFTSPNLRGQGIASFVLTELEKWASELSYPRCIVITSYSIHYTKLYDDAAPPAGPCRRTHAAGNAGGTGAAA